MQTRVVSIRLTAQTIASLYDYLENVCHYDIRALKIAPAIQLVLSALIDQVTDAGLLKQQYNTEEDASARINADGRGAYLPVSLPSEQALHLQPKSRVSQRSTLYNKDIEQNSFNNYDTIQGAPIYSAPETNATVDTQDRRSHLLNLISRRIEANEEQDIQEMLLAVKEDVLYKESDN